MHWLICKFNFFNAGQGRIQDFLIGGSNLKRGFGQEQIQDFLIGGSNLKRGFGQGRIQDFLIGGSNLKRGFDLLINFTCFFH